MLGKVRKGVRIGIAAERKIRKAIKKRRPLIKRAIVKGTAAASAGYRKSKPYLKKAIKIGKPAARKAIQIAKGGIKKALKRAAR